MIKDYFHSFVKKLLALDENTSRDLGNPKKILIIRQHNQLGDLLASVSLFRAIKQTYPKAHLTVIVSPANCIAIYKNKLIDRSFVFDKKMIYHPAYFFEFWKLLKDSYDVAIVPATVSISFTSNLISRFSNSSIRIGVKELNGMVNPSAYLFDRQLVMDWRKHPDSNVSDFCLDIVREFGISTNDFSSEISFDKSDEKNATEFLDSIGYKKNSLLIGLHVGAGKPPNRWSLKKFIELINRLDSQYKAKFYLTGSRADKEELDYVKEHLNVPAGFFIDRTIPEVAALISRSDIFITNDTGIMHVAGATRTPQVSIFGPTNPYNWAPVGKNKIFLWKSDLIDDITVDDVFCSCQKVLNEEKLKMADYLKTGN